MKGRVWGLRVYRRGLKVKSFSGLLSNHGEKRLTYGTPTPRPLVSWDQHSELLH